MTSIGCTPTLAPPGRGVYYVDTGAAADADGTPLHFFDPCQGRANTFLQPVVPAKYFVRAEPGMMVLFPSYIPHMVFPHKGERQRILYRLQPAQEAVPVRSPCHPPSRSSPTEIVWRYVTGHTPRAPKLHCGGAPKVQMVQAGVTLRGVPRPASTSDRSCNTAPLLGSTTVSELDMTMAQYTVTRSPALFPPPSPERKRALIVAVGNSVISHVDELSALDAAIGDGDHGHNMKRGFEAVLQDFDALSAMDLPDLLKAVGMKLVMKVGGASGPLSGTLFWRWQSPFQPSRRATT